MFTDANNGIAAGTSGLIMKTSDGGFNWINIPSGITSYINSLVSQAQELDMLQGDIPMKAQY